MIPALVVRDGEHDVGDVIATVGGGLRRRAGERVVERARQQQPLAGIARLRASSAAADLAEFAIASSTRRAACRRRASRAR
jgi:hypothetical protein